MSPSVCGNECRTTTTPATRTATSSSTSPTAAYDDQRPHRGHDRNPAVRDRDAGLSGTAAIVPGTDRWPVGGSGKFAKPSGVPG